MMSYLREKEHVHFEVVPAVQKLLGIPFANIEAVINAVRSINPTQFQDMYDKLA